MTVQWQELERITRDIENGKPKVIVYLHHSPKDNVVVKTVESAQIKAGKVFLGSYNAQHDLEDNRYKTENKRLQCKIEDLRSRLMIAENKVSLLKDILED